MHAILSKAQFDRLHIKIRLISFARSINIQDETMRNRITAILFFLLFTTASSYAAAVLTIYPQSSTPVSISTADNFTLTYTVTNTTSKANIQQITIDPYYQLVAPLLKLTLQDVGVWTKLHAKTRMYTSRGHK